MFSFLKWLLNMPVHYSANDSRLTRFMGMTLFLFNLFLQIYSFLTHKSFDYFIELISINYGMILMLLGIKGYFETQKVKYGSNGNSGSHDTTPQTSS